MKQTLLFLLSAGWFAANAQTQVPESNDSARTLQWVVVKAYEQNRQLKEVSASINYIDKTQLERYNNTSLLPALNATPGVHMEERSPGSYRLNVRGSTLRSPFGVRNVKVYWNGIPLTDPGGSTYLNQLSYFNVRSIEVIKGPAGSLYGAGTGGALLINSGAVKEPAGVSASYIAGSYHLHNLHVQLRTGDEEHRNAIGFAHQTSDGYRDHTNMRRDVITWEGNYRLRDNHAINTSVLYGDLYYQTPGGLNAAQYAANPRAARGPAGMFPGATEAKAAIYQKTFLAGISQDYQFNERFSNHSVVYGAFSLIKNPTFRNYEKRTEPHFGGRTVFTWQQQQGDTDWRILFGAEAQRGFFNVKTFGNVNGQPDTTQTDDEVDTWIYSGFVQTDIHFPGNWSVSAGISVNQSAIIITRLSMPGFVPVKQRFNSEWAPRLSVSKKVFPGVLLYASIARGFSPPTSQEVLPSTTVISEDLEAEHGVNYEAGIKSSWLQQRLYVEINAFYFRLQNAIVQRRDASNADYFVNAGSTKQRGIETQVQYQLLPRNKRFVSQAALAVAHTLNHFRYDDFKQVTDDFSDKKIPSVADNTVAVRLDVSLRPGLYTHWTWYYSDPIPLDDANTAFATSYNLLGGRLGFRKPFAKNLLIDIFAGVDNAFDVQYSLGNDINAAAGRYYNAAPGINYYGGIRIEFGKQRITQ
jgi:iron complex outermembrane receptor protein